MLSTQVLGVEDLKATKFKKAESLTPLSAILFPYRNTAVETVEQELLFVGTENGKLLAMRDIIKKVGSAKE